MKTYTKKIEVIKPRLVITYDGDTESPRKWDNLGYFITKQGKYRSPDGNDNHIYEAVIGTGEIAESQEDHIKLIKKTINAYGDEKVIAIYPVYRYEHGNVIYKLGTAQGFDISNCGFYIVTDKTQKLLGTPKKSFEKVIKQELEEYTQWANGEVFSFTLYDDNGDLIDAVGGFYNIDHIKEYLPDEFKNEDLSRYITY